MSFPALIAIRQHAHRKREDPYFKASYDNVDYSQIPAGFRGDHESFE